MTERECRANNRDTCRVHGFLSEPASSAQVSKAEFQEFITPPAKPAVEPRRLRALEVIRDYGDDVQIPNHGESPTTRPYVNLKDMVDGDVARGNCWAMTNELIEIVDTSAFDGAEWLDEISIETSWGLNHTALFVGTEDGGYVVDYTARQFDKSLPFPFIASSVEWKNQLSEIYGFPFKWAED